MAKKKVCTVGPMSFDEFARELKAMTPGRVLSRLRRKAAAYRLKKKPTAPEMTFAAAVAAIDPDPGQGHPCRQKWLQMVYAIGWADYTRMTYEACMSGIT